MSYCPAHKLFFCKDIQVPESIMLGMYYSDESTRFYFHDQVPGRFVMLLVSAKGSKMAVETHWWISESFAGVEFQSCINRVGLNEYLDQVLSRMIEKGFGK